MKKLSITTNVRYGDKDEVLGAGTSLDIDGEFENFTEDSMCLCYAFAKRIASLYAKATPKQVNDASEKILTSFSRAFFKELANLGFVFDNNKKTKN